METLITEDSNTMNVTEIADYIGCSTSMVRKLIRTKEIPFYKLGTKIIFEKSQIELWKLDLYDREGFKYEPIKSK